MNQHSAGITVPSHLTLHHLTHSTLWFDEQGILFIVPRASELIERVRYSQIKGEMNSLRSLVGNRKVKIIATDRKSPLTNKTQRKYVENEFKAITLAMAVIVENKLKRFFMNFVLTLFKPAYPMKGFSKVDEAKKWLSRV